MKRNSIAVYAGLILVCACAGRINTEVVDSAGKTERKVSLPSGATVRVPPSWSVTRRTDGITLTAPNQALGMELVELKSADLPSAWAARTASFSRKVKTTDEQPTKNGWNKIVETAYETSPTENRWVYAITHHYAEGVIVLLVDVPGDEGQRRLSEVFLIWNSLEAPGHKAVSFAGRAPLPLDEERLGEIRHYVEEAQKLTDVPGVAVAIFDRDKIYLAEGFGVRARGKSDPVNADTLFNIASNTKSMTTLLLARMVDEGHFEWDTPVVEVFPEFRLGDANTTKRVQIQHLICACTGLPRQDAELFFNWRSQTPRSQFEILATMQPTTKFGELFQYSNPLASAAGFVAGHVLYPDKELGAAYDQAMQDKVFTPLGMKHTTLSFEKVLASNYAAPHSFDASGRNQPYSLDPIRRVIPYRPAGGGWSSVRDFARYVQVELNNGRLLDGTVHVTKENTLVRRKPWVRAWGENQRYGMGLVTNEVYGVPIVQHGGSHGGYKSQFFALPEVGIGGVVLTNAKSGMDIVWGNFTQGMLEIIYGGEQKALEDLKTLAAARRGQHQKEIQDLTLPPDPSLAKQLADRYHSQKLGDVKVKRSAGALVFEFAGLPSRVASKQNPDGTISFVSVDPGREGFEFSAGKPDGHFERLTYQDPQHRYDFDEVRANMKTPN